MKDSTYVNVIPDPRFDYSNEIEVANHDILKRLDKTTEKLSIALSRVKESNEVVDKILLQLNDVKTHEGGALSKTSYGMKESLKKLNESATGSRPARQVGAWSSFQVTPQSKISEAHQALRARLSNPSIQDVQRVEVAEQLTREFIKQVDAFFLKDWNDYRTQVEAARLSWF